MFTERGIRQIVAGLQPRIRDGLREWVQLFRRIKRAGLSRTVQNVVNRFVDHWFDIRYGIDTEREVELRDLDIQSENKWRGETYQPTRVRQFRKLMNALDLPSDAAFVDFGSGKGRALLLASEHGFKRVVGVEFSGELCETARNNLSVYRKKTGIDAAIEIVESDVVDYEIRDDESVFFLNHPFDDVVLSKVLESIAQSVGNNPRKVWLIYQHPRHRDILERQTLFVKLEKFSHNFLVYVNRGDPFPTASRAKAK